MFKNLRVATKLGIGFAVVVMLALLQAGYSWESLHDLSTDITLLAEDRMVKVDQLSAIKDNANVVARAVRNMVLLKEPADILGEKKRIDDALARNGELIKTLEGTLRSAESRAALKDIEDTFVPYGASIAHVVELAKADKDEEATAVLLKNVRPLQAAHFKALDAAADLQRKLASQLGVQARADAGTAVLLLALLS